MTDILLIQPPVEDFYFTYKRSIPYGLASIAASLQQHGFSVEILDCLAVKKSRKIPIPEEMAYLTPYYGGQDSSLFSLFHDFRHYGYSFEYAGKVAREKKPFLVGISSLFTPYCHAAEKTAQAVKRFLPECIIVMGGHHVTTLPEEAMACSAVDFLLRGEGEVSMPQLALRLKEAGDKAKKEVEKESGKENGKGNGTFENIPGIVFRKNAASAGASGEKSLHISEPAWIEDFETLPLPDISLVNHKYYSRKNRGSTVVVAGRGCPMPCTYCSVGASSSHAGFRQRKVKDIIRELALQVKIYNIGFIDFEDENLTLNRKWFLEMLNQIRHKFGDRDIELRAMNGLYPPSLDKEMIRTMKRAGFKTLNLSLGSTSARQLKRFKRPDVRKSFEEALVIAENCSMDTVSYIIAGAPGQRASDSLGDLLYLAARNTLVGLSIFYPAPGSADYEMCRRKGILPEYFSQMRSSALPVCDTTSRLESVTLLRLARIVNFMKSLVNENGTIPEAAAYEEIRAEERIQERIQEMKPAVHKGMDWKKRKHFSVKLLQWFLYDGKIRGINDQEDIFEHYTDHGLCQEFLARLEGISMQGSYPVQGGLCSD